MSVGTRIPQQVDGFDTLRELLDLMKNPESLAQASELARKEMALTEAESKKYEEARLFMAQYDKLSKDLKSDQDKLHAEKQAHENTVSVHRNNCEEQTKYINSALEDINRRTSQLSEKESRNETDKRSLEAERSKLKRDHEDILSQVNSSAAQNERNRMANEAKKSELTNYELDLKRKAAKLRESALDI